jgi:hypothetical protein
MALAIMLGIAAGGAASIARAQTAEPVRVKDSGSGSAVLRAELRSAPDLAIWPSPSSLVPLYDAWELGYSSLRGTGTTRLAAGQTIAFDEGVLGGPATARSEATLTMVHFARKWTGGLPNGDELDGFLGLGVTRMKLLVNAGGSGFVEPSRNAPGLILGFGYRHDFTARLTLEARLGTYTGNPLYWFGSHDFMSGLTSEAVFVEAGFVWPRGATVALHAGMAGIRFVPDRESNESLAELRLWGPFLGIQAALR